MEGAEHYHEAERLLSSCQLAPSTRRDVATYPASEDGANTICNALAAAQVHATLALAAAQAMAVVEKHMGDSNRITEWGRVINWDTAPKRTPRCDVWRHNNGVTYQCFNELGHDGVHDFEGIPF